MTYSATPYAEVMSGGQPEPSGLACADSLKASKEIHMADKEDVVVPRQDEVSVYVNQRFDVVIKQEGRQGEYDHIVYIHPRYIPALCRALRQAAKDARDFAEDQASE